MEVPIAGQAQPAALDWESLYVLHAEGLLRYLQKMTADREVAADLLQETFVHAIRREAQLRDHDAVRGWLFGIGTNLARQHRRRKVLVSFLPFTGREPAPEQRFDLDADMVHRALASIPFDQAAALVLHYRSGFTRAEIAQLSSVTEEAVKSRLARGRANFVAAYRRLERGLRA